MVLLAFVVSMGLANAQKSAEAVLKAVEKAKADCDNPKKAAKVATWLNLAKAGMEAYTTPQGNGYVGASRQELQIIMNGVKPQSTAEEQVGNMVYLVETYPTCKYYFDGNGVLQFIKVTKPYMEDALELALSAYNQAAKVDVKGSKTDEIKQGIDNVAKNYRDEAYLKYVEGNFGASSEMFDLAAKAAATEPLAQIDSFSIYNAGATASLAGDYAKARDRLLKSIEIGHLEGGEAYAKLADAHMHLKDTVAARKALETGFEKCPENQAILVGLINYYLDSKENPDKLFVLIDKAIANEPDNASLFYVKGNIYKQLGDIENAVVAYDKCSEVNPKYEYGFIGKGILYYDEAVKYSDEAQNEFDQKKYEALIEQCDNSLLAAIEPFEKAYTYAAEDKVKVSIAEYLKNIYFRFREKSPDYQAAYDKYDAIVKAGR